MRLYASHHRTSLIFILALAIAALSCNMPSISETAADEEPALIEPATETAYSIPKIERLPWEESGYVSSSSQDDAQDQELQQSDENQIDGSESQSSDTAPSASGASTLRDPLPPGTIINEDNWDLEVLEVMRGAQAFERILLDDSDAAPPPPGMEYVVAKVRLYNKFVDEYSHSIGGDELFIVGDSRIARIDRLIDVPTPELVYTDSYTAEELIGWFESFVMQDEGNLMFVWYPNGRFDGTVHYLALEESASLQALDDLAQITPNDLGLDSQIPAPFGATAVTADWEIVVTDVLKGDEAFELWQQVHPGNDEVDEGMELTLVKMRIRYIGQNEGDQWLSLGNFSAATGEGVAYEGPNYYFWQPYDPPWMQLNLFPGGQHEGWMSLQSPANADGIVLRFEPPNATAETDVRYLSLEP